MVPSAYQVIQRRSPRFRSIPDGFPAIPDTFPGMSDAFPEIA